MSSETEQLPTKDSDIVAIFELMVKNEVFAKCPKCKKYMTLFETYNCNCSACGKINFNDIVLISI